MLRRRFMMILAGLFSRLNLKKIITINRKAKAIRAPAEELEADSDIYIDTDAPVIPAPASEAETESLVYDEIKAPGINAPASETEANKNIFLSVKADFIAYKRAAVTYVINIFTGRKAGLISGAGAVAKGIKAVKLSRKSGLLSANIVNLLFDWEKIFIKREAVLKSAAGRLVSAFKKTSPKNTASLITGEAPPGTQAKKEIYLETKREATAGTGTETEAKKNVFISVRAAFIAYNRAAAIYLHNIFVSRLSGLITGAGALAESRRTLQQGQTSEAGAADSENITSCSGFIVESEAEVGHAPPEDITASDSAPTAVLSEADHAPAETLEITAEEKADCGAEFAYWIYPEFDEDGVLIIRQVYAVEQLENGSVEVK